jgi:MoaA/NifB/PqqE/SkfB family radical SAM enzyme
MNTLATRQGHARFATTLLLRGILRRQLTASKLANMTLNLGYGLLRRPTVTALPSVLQIDINNSCNLQCPSCPTGLGLHPKGAGEMSYEAFCRIVDEVQHHVFLIVLYNSGEPFMHKDVYRMIDYAHRARIAVVTSTNGHFFHNRDNAPRLVDSGLDVLIVSISGITQATYSRYHINGRIDRVLAGLANLTAAKRARKVKSPAVVLRYLAFDYNRGEVSQARQVARELGVDHFNLRPAGTPDDFQMVRSALQSPGEMDAANPVKNHCYWLWSVPLVQHDGDLKPCCFLTLNPPDQGNVFAEGGVSKVWRGEAFGEFRRQMLSDKQGIPSCRHCPSFPGVQDFSLEKIVSRFRGAHSKTAS